MRKLIFWRTWFLIKKGSFYIEIDSFLYEFLIRNIFEKKI